MLKQFLKRITAIVMGIGLAVGLPLGVCAAPKKLSKNVTKGDIVYFGKYDQDGNTKNGKEKIEWEVLDKQGNKALLVSKKVLDIQPYHEDGGDITWEQCSLRKWLNNAFLKAGFSANEQKKIKNTKVVNKDNKYKDEYVGWHTRGGKDTTDKIFLLSLDEVKQYCNDDDKMPAEATGFTIKLIAKTLESTEKVIEDSYLGKNNGWWYWLRSPGAYQNAAARVGVDGDIVDAKHGIFVNVSSLGCRPVLWVDL